MGRFAEYFYLISQKDVVKQKLSPRSLCSKCYTEQLAPLSSYAKISLSMAKHLSLFFTHEMDTEIFLKQAEVVPLIIAITRFSVEVNVASDRQKVLENSGIDMAFISNLRLDSKPNRFAQELVSMFKAYCVSNQRSSYHPMVCFLKYLCELAPFYKLTDEDINLFAKLIESGEENFKLITAQNAVGRIESPKDVGIGTGVLIRKNLLLTCNHIFSKSQVQQAWIRFNYTSNSYNLESNLFELDLKSVTRSRQQDYALITVKGEPEQQIAVAVAVLLDSEQKVRLIHYPKGHHIVVSESGSIVQVGESYIDHNISTDEGSSGAPIFNKDWQLVAIHRGHPGTGAGRTLTPGTTSGIPIHAFWNKIQPNLS